ncbi:putative 1-acyl-sn-glycerol-3-phosphate acyltransferase acl-2 [Teleopsis dalmanni]|uniref:putative 1-acyl-sn-glycerol-3-phosphate acyltransferase acl-2 n=1 Tax=Teleopsis dalmanni TaxID=139649 RepID=UPI0018CCA730|nr:putative 1-acyl-sn-glycerol-3-phosphate acyltransferase acl-2 [Teleopsis dalmanni]XP_037959664.1 putative 1-acyl-sn-glycerol-3-phosphate acyltransferase acl-2 [Teleopsis dalmanni]XP_037959665.1 putative 1-acyl-sn-glycerol-3-phosphate acyltransferase acl-2 [Teleopsis dalmanni]XP_037959666.1 putative 1-acyl-sn-glycerol-3-phosphate acyltransferase acl-2 [Teleopsis dalmanni]XP_037959667.1 putative 1-acyl-sn-glycerol-3-phosphate acyltransferase acl-2 [Teleopsis dalmanni]XP_037959668.1 putative 1
MGCVCEIFGLACIVALIMSFSSRAPYQLKMAAFLIGSGVIVLICIPFMFVRPRDYRNALVPAWCCRQLCRALGVTMEVRGLENVRKENGSVVLMNHQSALDLCVLAYLWPVIGRATVVSKKEILYIPFFGFGAWLWGTLFINRSRKSDSIVTLQKESKAINERNCKLLLFPEGTRNSKETLLPFKKGSFHIALQSQCPIQPVVISKYWFLNSEKKMFRPGHAIIHIMPEIFTKGSNTDDLDSLIEQSRSVMQAEYSKLSQEAKVLNFKKQF